MQIEKDQLVPKSNKRRHSVSTTRSSQVSVDKNFREPSVKSPQKYDTANKFSIMEALQPQSNWGKVSKIPDASTQSQTRDTAGTKISSLREPARPLKQQSVLNDSKSVKSESVYRNDDALKRVSATTNSHLNQSTPGSRIITSHISTITDNDTTRNPSQNLRPIDPLPMVKNLKEKNNKGIQMTIEKVYQPSGSGRK